MRTAPHSRVAWIDYAKAIGITLVVLAHVNSGIVNTPGLSMGKALSLLNTFIYSFHMPLFFVLAGYVVYLRKQATTDNLVRDGLWSLAVPYVVWTVAWVVAKVAFSDFTANPITLSRLTTILWDPVGHMWFLFHLLLIRFGWHGLERALPYAGQITALVTAAILSMLFVSQGPQWLTPWFYLLNFTSFGFGMLVLPHLAMPETRAKSLKHAALGLCAWGVGYPAFNIMNGPVTPLFLGMVGTLMVVLFARALPAPRTLAMRVFAFIGEASMAIYVMHLFVVIAVRKALGAAGLLSEASLLAVATPLGVVLPALAFWGVLRSSGITGLSIAKYIGLGQTRNSRYLDIGAARPASKESAQPPLVAAAQTGG